MLARLFIAFITITALHGQAYAAEAWVDGRFYKSSPSYYTNAIGEFAVSYRATLPYGSKVDVHLGLGGTTTDLTHNAATQVLAWQQMERVPATAVAPYTWTARFAKTLHNRGQNWQFDKLQFVILVTLPSGEVYYEKGSVSELGYFEVSLPQPEAMPDEANSRFERLDLYSVTRG